MAFSLYEIDGYQDVAKPSDLLGENWYLQDVFLQTRPEVFDFDDHGTENNRDKRNPYYKERDEDRKEDKGDHQWDDHSYLKKPSDWTTRDDYLVKKSIQTVIANSRFERIPVYLHLDIIRTAATLNDLMRDTSQFSIKRAPKVRTPTQEDFDRRGRKYKFNVRSREDYSDPKGHTVIVQFGKDPEIKDIRALDLKVSCSCPFWQYRGPEYYSSNENYQYGPLQGTGDYPEKTNPEGQDPNKICKHVYAVGEYIRKWVTDNKKDTYQLVGDIIKELLKIAQTFRIEDVVKGIKDIAYRLPQTDRKKLVKLITQFEKARDAQKNRIFSLIVPELTTALDVQEKSFLKAVRTDMRNFLNMMKREDERVKREEKKKERTKKQEDKKKDQEEKKELKKDEKEVTKLIKELKTEKEVDKKTNIVDRVRDVIKRIVNKSEDMEDDSKNKGLLKKIYKKLNDGIKSVFKKKSYRKASVDRVIALYLKEIGENNGEL